MSISVLSDFNSRPHTLVNLVCTWFLANLHSSKLDWHRIIYENTPNPSPDNVYLARLCEKFINYAEIKLIT